MAVQNAPLPVGSDHDMLCFETLTLAPIDSNLIVMDLLDSTERGWLNRYHARVFETHGAKLTDTDKKWLRAVTASL